LDLPTEIAQKTAVDKCRATNHVIAANKEPSQTPVPLGWICPVGAVYEYVILVVEDLTCLE
jgi:hypothetical protein